MKQLTKFVLLALTVLALTLPFAQAASLVGEDGIAGQCPIYSVAGNGADWTSTLTDGSTATAWTSANTGRNPDLSISLSYADVGEIWIRNGYCYSSNYFNYYDRPDVIRVTIWYTSGRSNITASYRYRMNDRFDLNTSSASWSQGYQRLLLPQKFSGVTRIDLNIESTNRGNGNAGVAISDIIVANGQHATATPYVRPTATPRPYVQYVTPRPGTATPTPTSPLVELITPTPTSGGTTVYPSKGVVATLEKSIDTLAGPDNKYQEFGTFFHEGYQVNVISKVWNAGVGKWYYQVEFNHKSGWMRAYTSETKKLENFNPALVPTENTVPDPRESIKETPVYYGPGTQFRTYWRDLSTGKKCDIYQIVGKWAQIEYKDYSSDPAILRRGWVPLECLSTYPFSW